MNWKVIVLDVILFTITAGISYVAGLGRGAYMGAQEMWHQIHDPLQKKGIHICDHLPHPPDDSK